MKGKIDRKIRFVCIFGILGWYLLFFIVYIAFLNLIWGGIAQANIGFITTIDLFGYKICFYELYWELPLVLLIFFLMSYYSYKILEEEGND